MREERELSEPPFTGTVGAVVRALEPHSEADPYGLLVTALVKSCAVLGDAAYVPVSANSRQTARVYALLVGSTARARKGTAEADVQGVFAQAFPDFARQRTGLASGEGLAAAFAHEEDVAPRDPRLLVTEPEFARVLTAANREGSTLSPVLRSFWDGGVSEVLTRANPLRVEGAHLCLVAHITEEELTTKLRTVEIANGLLNRFLVIGVHRGRRLPHGGSLSEMELGLLASDWRRALQRGRDIHGPVKRTPEAARLWEEFYFGQEDDVRGVFGQMVARSEAHVTRLSLAYALLDGSQAITEEHHLAAVAVWRHAVSTVERLYPPSETTGNRDADRILAALTERGELTRGDTYRLFSGHMRDDRLDVALGLLAEDGRLVECVEDTGGRPRTVYRLAGV